VFIQQWPKRIGDDSITVEVLLSFPAATSPPHPEAMAIITRWQEKRWRRRSGVTGARRR
jgi:hypothetical protein